MFSLPNLPTDSLYKFVFISGIVLYIYSTYLLQNQNAELSRDQIEIDSVKWTQKEAIRIETLKSNRAKDNVNELVSEINKITKEVALIEQSKKNPKNPNEMLNDMLALKAKLLVVRAKNDSITTNINKLEVNAQIHSAKMNARLNKYEETLDDTRDYRTFAIVLFFAGLFSWFFRIQIPQDKLTKLSVSLAELQLRKEQRAENAESQQSESSEDLETTS